MAFASTDRQGETLKKMAFATLARSLPQARQITIEVVELDLPVRGESAPSDRFIVSVQQARRSGSALHDIRESSLTIVPCSRTEAERRALDFIQRRLAVGDVLERQQGFDSLSAIPVEASMSSPSPAAPGAFTVPARIAALAGRLSPSEWKLRPASQKARTVWRIAECSDAAAAASPAQLALTRLVPPLVDLLGSGDDLLDYCLAVAIGRLGDRGATEAMRLLASQARSPSTQRAAHQAWLMLLTPEAQQAHAAILLPDWQTLLHDPAPVSLKTCAEALDERGLGWVDLLPDWYDLALCAATPRAGLLALLKVLPLQYGTFQAVRYVYKAAEMRRDAVLLGLLHARFENTPANVVRPHQNLRRYRSPATGALILRPARKNVAEAATEPAYGHRTRDYLRLRAWRQLRRLAAIDHPYAPVLAAELLLGLDDADLPEPRVESRWVRIDGRYVRQERQHHSSASWLLVPKLLLAAYDGLHTSARATRWWTLQPLHVQHAMAQRVEGLPSMWDAHPEALLTVALRSRSALVHAVVARALQDHLPFVRQQPPTVLRMLLQSRYSPTAAMAFLAVRGLIEQAADSAAQAPWLELLADSSDAAAREFCLLHIAGDPVSFARHPRLVTALLLAGHASARRQGQGLALLAPVEPLLAELAAALLAADPSAPGLDDGCTLIEALLGAQWAEAVARSPAEPVMCLLDHPAAAVVRLGVTWLLLQPHGLALLPAATLTRLQAADEAPRRAAGVRLLAALPDEVLRTQGVLLRELVLHPQAEIRQAAAPALHRLLQIDSAFAPLLATHLHAALFVTEPGDGVHDEALGWLTQTLAAVAPARDASGAWRALQAQSTGAQRYGAWALAALRPSDYSLRQQATLARHADVAVRDWAMKAIDTTLAATPEPTHEQAVQLLPLADAGFDDARAYAQRLFGERLSDTSLSVELLIAWIDHPQPWVQALGRARLVRRMGAAEASLCLTRLSQHPSPQVQLFVTQWLLELPTDDTPQLAARMRALRPYFLAVLSQVQRGRVAKTRVIEFLRGQIHAAETATVVAEIFARQVVTASLRDKPQFIAGLRDIAARHPQIELPFLRRNAPTHRP